MTRTDCFHIRWMVRADMPAIMEIERLSFGDDAWTEADFCRCCRQRNVIPMIVERGTQVIGFVIYELQPKRLDLVTLAVHPAWRLRGVGSTLIDKLKSKLTASRRSTISVTIHESNLDGQLFLQTHGFRAVSVRRGYFHDDTDAYVMRFREDGE